jgi:hypothetical protein
MERTAAVRRKAGAEPMRLPPAVDLAQVESADAVRALRVLMMVAEQMVARKQLAESGLEVEDRRCPRRREEQAAFAP